ncbi:unnamed protein product [Miscanthus lutarioriparius]|uniref:Hexosyltransferase n=1 Tax=Miscanthus lutarioriparius TaxID=422564 RepID=A0A811MIU4_9POAL|nr:unnamed protein product [Miscanthus lutarioriparius]
MPSAPPPAFDPKRRGRAPSPLHMRRAVVGRAIPSQRPPSPLTTRFHGLDCRRPLMLAKLTPTTPEEKRAPPLDLSPTRAVCLWLEWLDEQEVEDKMRGNMGSLNDVGSVDVFSWISCLDLRTLAALANSTLSSSSDPQNVSFHFLIPKGGNVKLSYHKLKVLLPDSDLTVTSQKQIKDKLNVATPEGNFLWSFHTELSPFLIARSQLSKKRYVYIAADSIIKGKVEDLARMDLGSYAIGAVEDCSKRLNDYISMDVLGAIQRAGAAQSWVSKEPYNKDACLLDFDVLLIEPRKLEKNLLVPIMWWTNVINLANQRDQIRLAVTLAFYDKYMKLPSNWKRTDGNTDILNFDGPRMFVLKMDVSVSNQATVQPGSNTVIRNLKPY